MSNPQSKSSHSQESTVNQSKSTSKAYEAIDALIADNEAQRQYIQLLQETNNNFSLIIASRDLEIYDLAQHVADLHALSKDITVLRQQNDALRLQVNKQQKQQVIIDNLKQMLSLQQQIMLDVGKLQ